MRGTCTCHGVHCVAPAMSLHLHLWWSIRASFSAYAVRAPAVVYITSAQSVSYSAPTRYCLLCASACILWYLLRLHYVASVFLLSSPIQNLHLSAAERCGFGNWSTATLCQKVCASFCGVQLMSRSELLGVLQAGRSPPTANTPGLPRTPSGVMGLPRTPTGKPISFGTCAPHQGASASLPSDMLVRLSVAALKCYATIALF